jgi:hypothetical protein
MKTINGLNVILGMIIGFIISDEIWGLIFGGLIVFLIQITHDHYKKDSK